MKLQMAHTDGDEDVGKGALLAGGDGQTHAGLAAGVVELIPAQLGQLHAAQHGLELAEDLGGGAVGGVHDLRLLDVHHALDGLQHVGDGGQTGGKAQIDGLGLTALRVQGIVAVGDEDLVPVAAQGQGGHDVRVDQLTSEHVKNLP